MISLIFTCQHVMLLKPCLDNSISMRLVVAAPAVGMTTETNKQPITYHAQWLLDLR